MAYRIRPFDAAADYPGITPLINRRNGASLTPAQLEEAHARFPADGTRHRLVAVDEAGAVVGYGSAVRWPGVRPGQFFGNVVVTPAARGQGAGSALLTQLVTLVRESGGTRLVTGSAIDDQDTETLAFCQRRGFVADQHTLFSRLDLASFAGATPPEVPDVEFVPWDGTVEPLYELYKVTDLDSPGYLGTDPSAYPPLESWREDIFGKENEKVPPGGIIIAMDGDRWVGVTILQKEGPETLYTEYTGVLRAYRGRGIARSLKLRSIAFAQAYGARFLTTRNGATNAPMLAVNRRLGYEQTGGQQWLAREL